MAKQGFLSKAALGKETSWGSGVAVDEVIPMTNEDLNGTIAKLVQEYLDRTTARGKVFNSTKTVQGSVTFEAVYDETAGAIIGIDSFILGALGSATWDSVNSLNRFTVTDDINTSFTIAINKDGTVWEVQGAKVNSLELTGSAGGKITGSATLIGKDLLHTGDSGIVNSTSAVNGLNPSNRPNNVIFDHLTFRLGDTVDALTAADDQVISEFTLTINNTLTDPTFGSGSSLTLEPVRNGFREVTLNLTYPRIDSDQVLSWYKNNTELQATLVFSYSGKLINIYLPRLYISDVPTENIGGAGVIPLSFTLSALYNNGENSVMVDTAGGTITGDIEIETKNARTAAP